MKFHLAKIRTVAHKMKWRKRLVRIGHYGSLETERASIHLGSRDFVCHVASFELSVTFYLSDRLKLEVNI